ncbi:glycosyltransferase involved in cell wall biosynthesis [Flavobacterium sp. 270]|uniref:glycosyltransferase family 4 protein n=1 Tax=Flavobacterium sp. 270 TaxID=2512114 RepID=UPI0010651336|nr:glycosyltransferase family 4 protein [Flavobacterium sp. 270]TDW48589.1 glycosyltransferase involved in cell wall biosynthesis [Flavobacterium sp. 270]
MLKILQINKYHYVRGGSDSVYFNTTNLLKEHGHKVIHFAMDFDENELSSESSYFASNNDFTKQSVIQKITNMPSFFYNKDAEQRLKELIEVERPDVAHLHIFYGSLTSSILKVLKEYKIPIVVSVHDYKFVCSAYLFLNNKNEVCEKCEGKKHYEAIINKCVKGSRLFSTIFALEAYYRDSFYPIHKMFDRLIFVSKFSAVIHNKYKKELKDITSHLYNFDPLLDTKIANNKKGDYFLYSGRLSKEKGLKTLIRTFAKLPDIQLKIAGTGEEMESLKSEATSNIEFLGFLKGAELQTVILNSSFVITPSEWYENNPMAIIEALTLGKPVIGANIGGIPEIVIENISGFLFSAGSEEELRSKIVKADALSKNDYLTLSMTSRKFAEDQFSPQKHYEQLMKIYNDLINN